MPLPPDPFPPLPLLDMLVRALYGSLSGPVSGMVCRVTGGLVFTPFLHLGVEGLAAPLPIDGGLSGDPEI